MKRKFTTLAIGIALAAFAESAAAQIVVFSPTGTVVCETRRVEFSDAFGWRVRDIVVCAPR
jgi:hypothetical protein